ncbi:unnamed protein product [Pylaiella littoralis]
MPIKQRTHIQFQLLSTALCHHILPAFHHKTHTTAACLRTWCGVWQSCLWLLVAFVLILRPKVVCGAVLDPAQRYGLAMFLGISNTSMTIKKCPEGDPNHSGLCGLIG